MPEALGDPRDSSIPGTKYSLLKTKMSVSSTCKPAHALPLPFLFSVPDWRLIVTSTPPLEILVQYKLLGGLKTILREHSPDVGKPIRSTYSLARQLIIHSFATSSVV